MNIYINKENFDSDNYISKENNSQTTESTNEIIPTNLLNTKEEIKKQIDLIEKAKLKNYKEIVSNLLKNLDENLDAEIIEKTPNRYAEAFAEFTKGYKYDIDSLITKAIFNNEGFNEILIVKDLNFSSLCEHHLLPFFGECTIGYIPSTKILGLSKFPRLIDIISKKLSLQERLTKEIADLINKHLEPCGVVVILNSIHSCMCYRGIKSYNAKTQTIYTIGLFKKADELNKFFNLLNVK